MAIETTVGWVNETLLDLDEVPTKVWRKPARTVGDAMVDAEHKRLFGFPRSSCPDCREADRLREPVDVMR